MCTSSDSIKYTHALFHSTSTRLGTPPPPQKYHSSVSKHMSCTCSSIFFSTTVHLIQDLEPCDTPILRRQLVNSCTCALGQSEKNHIEISVVSNCTKCQQFEYYQKINHGIRITVHKWSMPSSILNRNSLGNSTVSGANSLFYPPAGLMCMQPKITSACSQRLLVHAAKDY